MGKNKKTHTFFLHEQQAENIREECWSWSTKEGELWSVLELKTK
jgi:hypothetical protein